MPRFRLRPLAFFTLAWILPACDDAIIGDPEGSGGAGSSTSTTVPESSSSIASSGSTTADGGADPTSSTATGDGGGAGGDGSGAGGGSSCEDACELDDVSCLQDEIIRCVVGSEGCTIWSAGQACPGEAPYCASGQCSAECADECQPNDVRCTDEGAEHCYATETPDGPCFRWEAPEPCDSSNACVVTGCEVAVGCTSDPVTCDEPPESECIDDDTLRVWDTTGACGEDGDCDYAQHDVACASCPSCDACEAVTCNTPPSTCFQATGECDEGSCSYDFDDDADCDDEDDCTTGDTCASGVCAGSERVCNDPDPPTCIGDDTLRTYSAGGACSAGECEYPFVDTTCDDACEQGACVGAWTPTTVGGAPVGRGYQSTVWTGSRMIVWGGYDGGGGSFDCTNAGGRYNPVNDSWSATTTTNAPVARFKHVGVWTNATMIVWGGIGVTGAGLQSGGRYDPSANTWTATSTTNAPLPTGYHKGVWTGSEMLVWGGQAAGGRYNPASDTWTPMNNAGAPSPREDHTILWTGSEVLVWGGDWAGPLGTGGRYDPDTDTWTNISTLGAPSPRSRHTAVWTGSEMIVWGGRVDDFTPQFADGAAYDPDTDTWTSLPEAPLDARGSHSALWTGTDMLIWGGYGGDPFASYWNDGAAYDPSTGDWTPIPLGGAPASRLEHSAVWTGQEMIVWGGANQTGLHFTGGRYEP